MKTLISIILLFAITGIIYMDLDYKFGNYDTAFILVMVCELLFFIVRRSTSKTNFTFSLLLLLGMSFSFIINGPVRITERMGEWFFIFLLFAILQYGVEVLFFNNKI